MPKNFACLHEVCSMLFLAVLLTYAGTNLSMYTLMGRCCFYVSWDDATLSDIFFHSVPRGAWIVPFHTKIVGYPPGWVALAPPTSFYTALYGSMVRGQRQIQQKRVLFTTSDQIWPFFRHKTLQIFIIKRKAL